MDGKPFQSNSNATVYEGEKARASLALAARPAVWSAKANLTAGMAALAMAAAYFRKERYSAQRGPEAMPR